MEKTGKTSEFSAAYKLKSGSQQQKKDARLRRRSVEWKNLRGEQVNKRRNLKNLSPLQEAKENHPQRSMYKDKTPTKSSKGAKPNDMREKLKKWREEKALKKKSEAQEKAKKQPFIIKHVIPTEKLHPSMAKKGIADSSKTKSNTMPLQPKSQNKESGANRSVPGSRKQGSATGHKDSAVKKSFSKPGTEKVSQSKNSKSATKRQVVPNSGRQVKDKTGSSKKRAASKRAGDSALDLRKVSTARGMSFAPEEFAFSAPNNLASFVFKPLSPASSENFLFSNNPDETAAFVATDVGRCSTPKKGRAASKVNSSEKEKSDSVKTRRQTRSQTKSISQRNDSLSVTDKSQRNDSLSVMDKSSVDETKSKTRKSSHKETQSLSQSKGSVKHTPVRRSLRSESVGSVKRGRSKRSASRDLASRSRSRKRSDSQEDTNLTKRRKSRRSVSIMSSGKVQVDVVTSPEQKKQGTEETEGDMETEDKESIETREEPGALAGQQGLDGEEVDSNRSVKLSNHSLTVQVLEKPSPVSSKKSSIPREDLEQEAEEVSSSCVEKKVEENNLPVSAQRKTRWSLKPESKKSNDTKELASEAEENNEVFEVESSPTPKRKSRRSIRLRPDFAEISESLTSGDKENAKPVRLTRRSVAAVDGFKLPSESLSAKRPKPKQRRHTLHIAKSPEEWVQILKSSPMVEMSRRTPKQKSPVSRLPAFDLELDLDDLNLPPKEEVHSDLDISKVIMANLNSSMSADEAELAAALSPVKQTDNNEMPSDQAVEQQVTTTMQDKDTAAKSSETGTTQNKATDVKSSGDNGEEEHNVQYFRNLLSSETARYNVMCEEWETVNTPDLSEEVQGQIRTVIGQAQLLIAQRFKQFSGLVDDCEFNRGEKETTCTDLQGFWDMIYFQVEDVDKKFAELQKRREGGWVRESPKQVKKVVKKKNINKPILKKPVKSKFAAFKASMKSSVGTTQTIEHDWGLFKVTSPLRKPTYHCEAGSPKPKAVDSPMPLQPRPDLSGPEQEEEESSSQSEPVVSQNPPAILVEDVPVIKTPKRQSYLPIIPSPLLQDCTPKPRFTRSLLKTTPIQPEDRVETPRPRRQSLRRSINLKRKSVSFVEEPEKTADSPANESFSKYLQPTQSIPEEEASSPVSIMDSYFSEEASSAPVPSSCGKSAKSTLKQSRRKSARRSVSFCSPVPERDSSSLRHPPTPHRSLVQEADSDSDIPSDSESKFASLNVAFTPVTRSTRSRPSLLYTPPDLASLAQRSPADVAVGTLISFSP